VGECPFDGELADFAVVFVDVGAAAVLEVAADRVVVVAVDGREARSSMRLQTSFGCGP
jgi:hypothetical protein